MVKVLHCSAACRQEEFMRIVSRLLTRKGKARGVIVYGSDQEVHELMRAVRVANATGEFTWIGSDGWSSRALVYANGHEPEVLGTISVQPRATDITGFKDYFQELTVENNKRNPWFWEFWEKEHGCYWASIADDDRPAARPKLKTPCTGRETKALEWESQLQFVSDAVLAFAYALRNEIKANCSDEAVCTRCFTGAAKGPQCANHPKRLNGKMLKRQIEKVEFTGLAESASKFKFYEDKETKIKTHDPVPRYNIIHFRSDPHKPKSFTWTTVGSYADTGLVLNLSALEFHTKGADSRTQSGIPISHCSEECSQHQIKKMTEGGCCWACLDCGQWAIRANETSCAECAMGWLPNEDKSACHQIHAEQVPHSGQRDLVC